MQIKIGRDGTEILVMTKSERLKLQEAIVVCRQLERHGDGKSIAPLALTAAESLDELCDLLQRAAAKEVQAGALSD